MTELEYMEKLDKPVEDGKAISAGTPLRDLRAEVIQALGYIRETYPNTLQLNFPDPHSARRVETDRSKVITNGYDVAIDLCPNIHEEEFLDLLKEATVILEKTKQDRVYKMNSPNFFEALRTINSVTKRLS